MVEISQRVKDLARVFDPTRVRILQLLISGENCVCKMVGVLEVRHSLLSHHLSVLTDLGYLESDRNGNHILYRIKESRCPEIEALLALVSYVNKKEEG